MSRSSKQQGTLSKEIIVYKIVIQQAAVYTCVVWVLNLYKVKSGYLQILADAFSLPRNVHHHPINGILKLNVRVS